MSAPRPAKAPPSRSICAPDRPLARPAGGGVPVPGHSNSRRGERIEIVTALPCFVCCCARDGRSPARLTTRLGLLPLPELHGEENIRVPKTLCRNPRGVG